jgi:hypothetical protein
MYRAILSFAFISLILTSCSKDAADSISALQAAGWYNLNNTSYSVPLNGTGGEVTANKVSLDKESLKVIIGNNDTLYFESKNIGYAHDKANINGTILTVNIAKQEYKGINLEPFLPNTLVTEEPISIEKKDGKFKVKGSVLIDRGSNRSRVRFSTDFE